MTPKQWTPDEEIALERCYMDESENKTKCNSQKRENFWKKVTITWHNVMGFDTEYRTYHQLNSKWKDICTKLTKFSVIYSNCANNRKSGMSDENVLRGPRFFKKNKKFRIERVFAGGSTAHTNYAVNLEDDEEEAEFNTPPEPVRPTGRDTTKRASSSSRQTVSCNPTTTDLANQLQAFKAFQKQKHEDRKKMHEEKVFEPTSEQWSFCLPKCSTTKIVK
ncbi:hypothetical protein R6Q57_019053 [Mikania cordata]